MKRRALLAVLLVFALGNLWAQDAKELNTRGLDLYKQGKFEEAIPFFEQAIEADGQYVYGHYNLACTLAILLRQDFCSRLEDLERIYRGLEATLELKPSHRDKMLEDEDLSLVRRMFWFWQLVGYSVYDPGELRVILINVTWAVGSVGVYGPPQRIVFGPGEGATYFHLEVMGEGPTEVENAAIWEIDSSGEEPVIVMTFEVPLNEKNTHRATLSPDGRLYLDGMGMFFAYVADCGV